MLLKGIDEVRDSGRPLAAAEMVLVRIAYAADLPTPDEVIRSLGEERGVASAPQGNGGGATAPAGAGGSGYTPRYEAPRGAPRSSAAASPRLAQDPVAAEEQAGAPTLAIASFAEIIALAQERRDVTMKMALERDVRLVRCEDGRLEIALEASAAATLVHDLQRKLTTWTGRRWMVVVSKEEGAPTVRAQAEARQAEVERGVQSDPLVQAVLNRFPGAKIVNVTQAAPDNGFDGEPPTEAEQED
jgi:DNA polymerase-3 subunit gamma/tau